MTFRKILIPIDGSTVSMSAAKTGCDLARALGAEIATLYVVEPPVPYSGDIGIPPGELQQLTEQEDRNVVSKLRAQVELPATALHFLKVGHPSDVIGQCAEEWGADFVVIGSHGRTGLGRALLGSVAESVVRHAPCPVLVVRSRS